MIHWIRLCGIVGRVGKQLARRTVSETTPVPLHLFVELREWAHSLPVHLRLPFSAHRTAVFSGEIHQLHLPYLTSITILHLSKSTQPLPKACTAGVLAASCMARIFKDLLARGSLRFLKGMAGWYIAIAMLALLHARQVKHLSAATDQQISILRLALKEMAKMWHSSKMFDVGFERLLRCAEPAHSPETTGLRSQADQVSHMAASMLAELATHDGGVDVLDYFPYATAETTPPFAILMAENQTPFPEPESLNDLTMQLHGLFETPFEELNYDVL